MEADELLDEDLLSGEEFDAIIMPGGLPGAHNFRDSPLLIETLRKYLADDTKLVGAICATPAVVLQTHGLIKDYDQITCYPAFKDEIDVGKYTDEFPVVRSKNLITSQGPGTAIEFSVAIVEALYGQEKANEVA